MKIFQKVKNETNWKKIMILRIVHSDNINMLSLRSWIHNAHINYAIMYKELNFLNTTNIIASMAL